MIDFKEVVCNMGNNGVHRGVSLWVQWSWISVKQHRGLETTSKDETTHGLGGAKRVEIAQDGPHWKNQPNHCTWNKNTKPQRFKHYVTEAICNNQWCRVIGRVPGIRHLFDPFSTIRNQLSYRWKESRTRPFSKLYVYELEPIIVDVARKCYFHWVAPNHLT